MNFNTFRYIHLLTFIHFFFVLIKLMLEISLLQEEPQEVKDDEERTQFLQRVLLDYLAIRSLSEPALRHARHFYLAQWYQDNTDAGKSSSNSLSKRKKKNSRKKFGKYWLCCSHFFHLCLHIWSNLKFKVQTMKMVAIQAIPATKLRPKKMNTKPQKMLKFAR